MGVLSRDLAAYQTALDAYNRQLRGYNSTVRNYNDSLILDAQGKPMLAEYEVHYPGMYHYYSVDDKGYLKEVPLPAGVDPATVGVTALEGQSQYWLARQNIPPGGYPPEKPGEWGKTFDVKAPNPTKAEIRRESTPSLAEMEAGLIGEAIRGRGVRYGTGGSPVVEPGPSSSK